MKLIGICNTLGIRVRAFFNRSAMMAKNAFHATSTERPGAIVYVVRKVLIHWTQ
ncbi:hypothetical protein J8F10_15950 [Gemmata sp. G18]|uniref:Uncharacterized protein n=1 Tax=Gemmata palustris TaxID=2822762 RepID=A0ABS5BSS7_9BACT|nr:hypothetical protein [Gemmata palustris]MBP3956766.1 hypothetical protein [Gemmata palustris]